MHRISVDRMDACFPWAYNLIWKLHRWIKSIGSSFSCDARGNRHHGPLWNDDDIIAALRPPERLDRSSISVISNCHSYIQSPAEYSTLPLESLSRWGSRIVPIPNFTSHLQQESGITCYEIGQTPGTMTLINFY